MHTQPAPTLFTLTPLSRPAGARALHQARHADAGEGGLRLDQLASLQHAFRLGVDTYPDLWSTRAARIVSESLPELLVEAAVTEKLLTKVEGWYASPDGRDYMVGLAPEHQVDLLLKLKLVRGWEAGGASVMCGAVRPRGPLIAELLANNAAHAVNVDAGEAFYVVFRAAARGSRRGPALRRLAAGLGVAAREQVIDAAPLLRVMANLAPFAGTDDELFTTARSILA